MIFILISFINKLGLGVFILKGGNYMEREYKFTFKNGWSCIAPNLDFAMYAFKAEHGYFGIVIKREKP